MTARIARDALLGIALSASLWFAVPAEASPDIANGLPTQGWPSVASLTTFTDAGALACTAVFVGCQTVLTAAHCVCDGTEAQCAAGQFLIEPSQMFLHSQHGGFYFVRDVRIPPSYEFAVSSDIAVLRLVNPLRGIAPARINRLTRPLIGSPAQIVGFGDSFAVNDGGIKQAGSIALSSCLLLPGSEHLCWTLQNPVGLPGSDSAICQGDSGGPLFADVGDGLVVAGIHSGAFNIGGVCAVGDPNFDTDVFVNRAWIEAQAGVDLDSQSCGDGPQVGDAEVGLVEESGSVSSQNFHTLVVPVDTKLLRVSLNAEDGSPFDDFDLYVKFGTPPSVFDADCASTLGGSMEYCEFVDPAAGTWHLMVDVAVAGPGDYQLTSTLLPEDPDPGPVMPGDLIIADFVSDEIFRVDATSGDRRIVSSSLRGSGPPLAKPESLFLDAGGTIVVTNLLDSNLLRVDLASGDRSVVSGCLNPSCSSQLGSGPPFLGPRFVDREDDNHWILSDRAVDPGVSAIVRVAESSGDRSIVSGCNNALCSSQTGAGPAMDRVFGVAVEEDGGILAVVSFGVLRIDPANGNREVVSGCTTSACLGEVGGGPSFGRLNDFALAPDGNVWVADGEPNSPFRAIFHVDTDTGLRTIVSGCGDPACQTLVGSGPNFGSGAFGLAVAPTADHLLAVNTEHRAVFRVELPSGNRSIVSGCTTPDCPALVGVGTLFSDPIGIAVPEPDPTFMLWTSLGLLLSLRQRRARACYSERLRCVPLHGDPTRSSLTESN